MPRGLGLRPLDAPAPQAGPSQTWAWAAPAMACVALAATQVYVGYNQAFDASTLAVGVVFPLAVGVLALVLSGQRILLWAYLGVFWSVVDDGPVYFDSVFTWPEVTRFHPALPHLALEVALHVVTALFLVVFVVEARRGSSAGAGRRAAAYAAVVLAMVATYAQNIPLDAVQGVVETSWYYLDVGEHLAAVALLAAALVLLRRRLLEAPRPAPG